MTNISRSKTKTKEFKALTKELARTIAGLNQTTARSFVDELFTESERIMFVKRFGALVMFKRGYSQYKVWNTLHLSPSTAEKLYERFERGEYDNLLRDVTENKMPYLIKFIDKLIRMQGKERWIFINDKNGGKR